MVSFYDDSKEFSRIKYGWDTELECSKCKYIGKPRIGALTQDMFSLAKHLPVLHVSVRWFRMWPGTPARS